MIYAVIDTNVLVAAAKSHKPDSSASRVLNLVFSGIVQPLVCEEILAEYEEILTQKIGPQIASNIIQALLDLPNTKMVQVYYHLHLIIADPDDDKFVDCAFKANAKYIVTQDHHYDVLRNTPFPKIEVVDIDEFLSILR